MSKPSITQIIHEVAASAGYTADELLSDSRRNHISYVRQYAVWRARRETGRSWCELARIFKRDHTTLIYSYRKIEALPDEVRGVFGPRPVIKMRKPFKPAQTFQGRPCIHGHSGVRFTSSGKCVACTYEQELRRYRAQQGDQMGARGR